MLTPSQYDQLADSLAELYAQLEESILQDMVRRMLKMGYLSDATEWQARMLQEAGMLYDDILAEIAQRTGSTQEQLRTVFQNAGIQAIRNDNYYYQQANVFTHRSMSDSALQVLNAGYVKCSGNLKNLTLTTANTSQQAFIQACNLAYMQVSSGMMDYNTAIRKAVQNAAQSGSTVLYPSGHKDKLDVAVRRAVLTGVGQTVRQVSFQNAKDLETDLMELTAHAGARPSHAEWQGQIVSLSGRKGYLTTQEIGYGSVDGFGGVNCRHDWHPYFEGLPRTYSPERLKELNEPHIQIGEKLYTDYEVSQMQRALERKIREKKRQVLVAQSLNDQAEFQKKSAQLKQAEQKLKDFLKRTGFLNDSARLWVNGFGRSQAQKAVWANRKYQQKKDGNSITLKAVNPSLPEYLDTAKTTRHTKEERQELVKYAKEKGIRLFGISRFDGESELLKEQIDSISKIRKEFHLNRKLTVCFKQMAGGDLGETRPGGEVIYLNKKAYRNRAVTDTHLNADKFLSSSAVKGIGIHEMGHVISAYYGEKGLDIAKKTYYNIYKKEIAYPELLEFLKDSISLYSTFLPEQWENKPLKPRYYKEITPEILAKHETNPDEFTSEFVRLLKEVYHL